MTSIGGRFTGKERDQETGLDFFEVRYMSAAQGRFMSPDPLGGHVEDPQTLNRYAYVRNNPTTLSDPTGLDFNLTCTENGTDFECENGARGTRDKNGKFTATVIRNDRDGNLVDQNGSRYNARVTGAGVLFTLAGSDQSSAGVFINGSSATSIQGSGDLAGFLFNFTSSKMESGVNARGTFSFSGLAAEAAQALVRAGFESSTVDDLVNIFHMSDSQANARNFRSAGDPIDGSGSGHFTVRQRVINDGHFIRVPLSTVPTSGDLHLGEHNPWGSRGAFMNHAREVLKYLGF